MIISIYLDSFLTVRLLRDCVEIFGGTENIKTYKVVISVLVSICPYVRCINRMNRGGAK